MILLTGATGLVGTALLRRLTAEGESVRCLVRDPRRLGAERVRVQIALGERAGVEKFVFFSALQASTRSRARFFRAKALAERAVADSSLGHTVFAPSIVYSPGDPWLRLLERMSLLPV